jgi:hypothetical protein
MATLLWYDGATMDTAQPSQPGTPRPADKRQPWHYVPPAEFRENSATVEVTVRSRFAEFWQSVRNQPESAESDIFEPADSLDALPQRLLQRVAPPTDAWARAALETAILRWLEAPSPGGAPLLFSAAPHVSVAAALSAWAAPAGWTVVKPPTPAQILAGDLTWLEQLPPAGAPWVLPALERCFLRHVHGLNLVRALLNYIFSSTSGKVILGCDAWALAYLRHVWHVWPATILTLQALDGEQLAAWFNHLANPGAQTRFIFRQADNGAYVSPPTDGATGHAAAPKHASRHSDFLTRLALYSRGNPGVAWAIWRQSLLADADNPPRAEAAATEDDQSTTIWVNPWERIKHPALPVNDRRALCLLLHTLLVHGGLPGDLLQLLVAPVDRAHAQTLSALHLAGFVEQVAGCWQVTAVGFSAARLLLKNEGYLTD